MEVLVDSTEESNDQEPLCPQCQSPFVELIGQGVEEFLGAETEFQESHDQQPVNVSQQTERTSSSTTSESVAPGGSSGAEEDVFVTTLLTSILSGALGGNTRILGNNVHWHVARTDAGNGIGIRVGRGLANILGGDLTPGNSGGSNGDALAELMHHILMNENSHPLAKPATADAIASFTRTVPLDTQEKLVRFCSENSLAERARFATEDLQLDHGGDSVTPCEDSTANCDDPAGQEESRIPGMVDRMIICCPITQEQFVVNDEALLMTCCSHIFHRDALLSWLSSNSTCPVCRTGVVV